MIKIHHQDAVQTRQNNIKILPEKIELCNFISTNLKMSIKLERGERSFFRDLTITIVWVIRNGRWSILLFILGKLINFLKWMDIFFSELIACSINALQSKNIQLKNHDWIFTISGLCLFKMCAFLVLQKKVFYCRIYSVCCNTYVAVNPQKIEKRNCGISRKNKSYSKWIFSYLIFFDHPFFS